MSTEGKLHIAPIDLNLHADMCVSFLQDSFSCSFGNADAWNRKFGPEGHGYIKWLHDYSGEMLHAWRGGKIVGELIFDLQAQYLQHLYVIPPLRGIGIGNALHEHFINILRHHDHRQATVKVSRTNLIAIRAYQRWGWKYSRPDTADPKLDVYELVFIAPVAKQRQLGLSKGGYRG